MDNKNTILTELTNSSPLLAALPKINVYTAPANYFNDFTTAIITLVSTPGFMDDVARYNPSMQVPEAYFDELAANILNKVNTRQQVPIAITNDIELSNQLLSLRRVIMYKTPLNYFDEFSSILLKKINAFEDNATIETNSISPVVGCLNKQNILEAPPGYFNQLPNLLLNNSKPIAKVITLQKRNLFIRYAAAAMLIGIISIVVVKFNTKPSQINGTYAFIESSITKGIKMDDKKFDETLNNLSEDDIATYLQKNGTEADLALLTASIEENNVPAEEEYFTDEKTLENFLNEINTKNLNN